MNNSYPSLETCKKIAHLFDDTEMWWNLEAYVLGNDPIYRLTKTPMKDNHIPAPNFMELLERFPEITSKMGTWKITRWNREYIVGSENDIDWRIKHESLPEALGQMLIKLDEEGLL